MYDRLQELMDLFHVTAYKVSEDTGIPTSYFARWKKTNSIPKAEYVVILSNYFNVSADWLLTGEERNGKTLPSNLLGIIEDDDLMSVLSLYMKADENSKKKVIDMIKLICGE